jgi:hypothetical protein
MLSHSRPILALVTVFSLVSCAERPAEHAEPRTADSPLPGLGRLVCERDGGTSVETPVVAAQSDGVHFRIESRLDEPASINGLGTDVDPGTSEVTLSTPPGKVEVACWPFSQHRDPEPPTVEMRIVDSDGLYVSPEIECSEGTSWSSIFDFMEGTHGSHDDPVKLARKNLKGLRPNDTLELAGYPEHPVGVRVVREGRTVAVVDFERTQDGGLLVAGGSGCSEDGVNVS